MSVDADDLTHRIVRGDELAIAALYDRAAAPVYTLALALVEDPRAAQDVTLQVFRSAWCVDDGFESAARMPVGWLLDRVEKLAYATDAESSQAQNQEVRATTNGQPHPEGVRQLSRTQRAVLVLAACGEYHYEEIAAMLGSDKDTIAREMRLALDVVAPGRPSPCPLRAEGTSAPEPGSRDGDPRRRYPPPARRRRLRRLGSRPTEPGRHRRS